MKIKRWNGFSATNEVKARRHQTEPPNAMPASERCPDSPSKNFPRLVFAIYSVVDRGTNVFQVSPHSLPAAGGFASRHRGGGAGFIAAGFAGARLEQAAGFAGQLGDGGILKTPPGPFGGGARRARARRP